MDKHKFFKEVSNFSSKKFEFASKDEADIFIEKLRDFRIKVGETFNEQNVLFDETDRLKSKWRDLTDKGEGILSEYYTIVSDAESLISGIEATANELGISVDDIPFIQTLKNNLRDTMEDEDAIVDGVRFWSDQASS